MGVVGILMEAVVFEQGFRGRVLQGGLKVLDVQLRLLLLQKGGGALQRLYI